ncbi:hypothetical protein GCM10018793_17950 [Streptomyces sulfonofaciens]|uniref:Histidine kinase/HSP90-like ATPase domain-containing protein n=1 Tax=Streptomyces sulfonofaciens TaxID=68272 RepID=A0A919G0E3_9ACTN|nr:ATP-binding protein [Streptomyces sulfonofaciens]GHH75199.1 hypothetical protein GCM10018793_17950 [Streptomyces sulfonofaciens]
MAPPAHPAPSVSAPRGNSLHRALALRLPAVLPSVGRARAGVCRLLREWRIGAEVCDDAALVISELVTNAIAHTPGDQVVCRVHAGSRCLRIEVEDQGSGASAPLPRTPGPDDQCGRGLLLVGVLSSAWGVREGPGAAGRTVWAELATPSAPPACGPDRSAAPLPGLVPHPPRRSRPVERSTVPDCDRP